MTGFGITPPGGAEWLIILALFVLLFGAKKLPELGSSVGKSIRNFKQGVEEGQGEGQGDGDGVESGSPQDSEQLSRDSQ